MGWGCTLADECQCLVQILNGIPLVLTCGYYLRTLCIYREYSFYRFLGSRAQLARIGDYNDKRLLLFAQESQKLILSISRVGFVCRKSNRVVNSVMVQFAKPADDAV